MDNGQVPDYLVDVGLIEEESNGVRILTLNRPHKLNCITLPMVKRLCELFEKWETDSHVKLIIMKGAGRAFCAGGDLRMFYRDGKRDGSCREVVYRKYWLDFHLHTYKKPMVAFLNGLVMGGGAGLTMPCRFRIVTEKTVFAMPEAGIGYHTDVAASFFLSHLPGYFGDYLAMTGARIDGADMVHCGLATHFVQSEKLQELEASLLKLDASDDDAILATIEKFSSQVELGPKSALQSEAVLNETFSKENAENILELLDKENMSGNLQWIKESVKVLKRSSPTGLKMTFRSVREGRNQSLADCLHKEFRLTLRTLASLVSNDLYEGIRATVIDKDNAPKWDPAYLSDVTEEMLDRLFEPFKDPTQELQLPDMKTVPRWEGKFETTI